MEGGRYVGLLLSATMAELFSGRRNGGGSSSGGGNHQFKSKISFLPIKTCVANLDQYQDLHQDINPLASAIHLSTLLSPTLTSCPANVEQSSPNPAPSTVTQRPASHASTPPIPVFATQPSPCPAHTTPDRITRVLPLTPQHRLWDWNHGGSAI